MQKTLTIRLIGMECLVCGPATAVSIPSVVFEPLVYIHHPESFYACCIHQSVESRVKPRYLSLYVISNSLSPRVKFLTPGSDLLLVNETIIDQSIDGLMFSPTLLHHPFARPNPICTISQREFLNLFNLHIIDSGSRC